MTTDDHVQPQSPPASTTGRWAASDSTTETAPTIRLLTDRLFPSFGLLGLRLVVAAVVGVHAYQKLRDLDAAKAFFAATPIFAPHQMAVITAIGEAAIAIGCLLGVAVRVAGLGALLVGIGALVYVKWQGPVFSDEVQGFAGDTELLLAGAGLALLALGGGAWGLDRWFRERNKRGLAAVRG